MSSTEHVVQKTPPSGVQTEGTDQVDGGSKDAEIAALREEKKQLEAKLGEQISVSVLGLRIEEMRKKLEHSQAELQKSKQQNEILKEVIKTKEDELTNHNEQLNRIDALTSDNNQLREEKKQLEAKLGKRTSVGGLCEQNAELTKTLEHSQAELLKSEQQNEILKAVIKTKEDEITSLDEQLKGMSEQLRSKRDELAVANEKLLKVESERRVLQEASAETGADTENVESQEQSVMQSDEEEDSEVQCQLTTLQRRYDKVVLETATLRNKLFYATAQHGIYLVQLMS